MNTKIVNKHPIFDTHCHLDFPAFEKDRQKLYQIARANGLQGLVIPGVKREGWRFIRQITALMEGVHCALGLHPMFISQHQESDIHDLEMALSVGPVIAVGEIGLDFQDGRANQKEQEDLFDKQLAIAKNAKLPVIIHCRKAHEDILRHIKKANFEFGGVIHSFNGDLNQAKRYADFGFKLGVGGAMTFHRAVKIRSTVKALPLDQIVLETDAPDMPPATAKSKRNTPVHIIDNLNALAALREDSIGNIAQKTTANAFEVFRIEQD